MYSVDLIVVHVYYITIMAVVHCTCKESIYHMHGPSCAYKLFDVIVQATYTIEEKICASVWHHLMFLNGLI